MRLTKHEAIAEMKVGKKVYHDLFTGDEHIWMDTNGNIVDEQYNVLTPDEYWMIRHQPYWETDWHVVENF